MPAISHLVRIAADPMDVFNALTTNDEIANWFTETECEGWMPGASVQWFGETKMNIDELVPNKVVSLRVDRGSDWEGTTIRFEVEEMPDKTRRKTIVRFDQEGWGAVTDHFRDCSMSWAYFLESLKLYLETGVGTPEGTAPACEST